MSHKTVATVLGLDVGTQGARAIVCTLSGEVVARAEQAFPPGTVATDLPPGYAEQDPEGWWQAVSACLRQALSSCRPETIQALSVTSTSGTILLLDTDGCPLTRALMYNDTRAQAEADEVQAAGAELAARLGYRFNASFGLARLLWLARHEPHRLAAARHLVHAADFIVGRLTGTYNVTDYSNALKSGYDLSPGPRGIHDRWPDFIGDALALPTDLLPRVVAPGEVIATVSAGAAGITGLRSGTPVVAGMTDGCAGQIAAGAVAPGEWNSTLGTTLVVKGVTATLVRDPLGRIYSHRHPDGHWLPGGASNVGGEALAVGFPGADLRRLDQLAASLCPTDLIVYPLVRRGERFPFLAPQAEGFSVFFPGRAVECTSQGWPHSPAPDHRNADAVIRYAACLEGVAYVERLAYDILATLGAGVGDAICAAGAAARSDVWLQIRADVLYRRMIRPLEPGAAMGAAILAASRTAFDGLIPAARAMVNVERSFEPRPMLAGLYDERYRCFHDVCAERGYV